MKYKFIADQEHAYSVKRMCQVLGVQRSGYYAWKGRPLSQRAQANAELLVKVCQAFYHSRCTYGSLRIHHYCLSRGWNFSRHRVARLMKSAHLIPVRVAKWHPHTTSPFVTVGGNVSGYNSGTLALWNNGGDRLAIASNGAFTFPLQIANGSQYAGSSSRRNPMARPAPSRTVPASGNVKGVTVTCAPYTFERRPLPAIYSTGKAVNYSPYRTAGGPRDFEVPSDAEVLQDLTLLDVAGFDLGRLFGAEAPATDVVAEKILRLAA